MQKVCRTAPGFEHLIYAPGFYTGYGVKTIPGVREAIEQKRSAEAERTDGPRGESPEGRSGSP